VPSAACANLHRYEPPRSHTGNAWPAGPTLQGSLVSGPAKKERVTQQAPRLRLIGHRLRVPTAVLARSSVRSTATATATGLSGACHSLVRSHGCPGSSQCTGRSRSTHGRIWALIRPYGRNRAVALTTTTIDDE